MLAVCRSVLWVGQRYSAYLVKLRRITYNGCYYHVYANHMI